MACFAKPTLKPLCLKGEAPLNAISAACRKASTVGVLPASDAFRIEGPPRSWRYASER